jgi:hypothetical protein
MFVLGRSIGFIGKQFTSNELEFFNIIIDPDRTIPLAASFLSHSYVVSFFVHNMPLLLALYILFFTGAVESALLHSQAFMQFTKINQNRCYLCKFLIFNS